MQTAAGICLVVMGLLIAVLGTATGASRAPGGASRARLPRWVDTLINWAIGLLCAWFGVLLILGKANFG